MKIWLQSQVHTPHTLYSLKDSTNNFQGPQKFIDLIKNVKYTLFSNIFFSILSYEILVTDGCLWQIYDSEIKKRVFDRFQSEPSVARVFLQGVCRKYFQVVIVFHILMGIH